MSEAAAILLVGGRGTRLAPLTDWMPKPMLPVGGVPFTLHQILQAREAGIREIVLATSYRAEVFEPYFGDGERFGLSIRYAVEESARGTGGGIRNAARLLTVNQDAPVVVFNGDVLSAHDLGKEIKLHRESSAEVTLYLTSVKDARAYGVVPTDAEGRVEAFLEKMEEPVTNQINAGCYVFTRSVIDEIPEDRVVSVEREVFPALVASGRKVQGFIDNGYWRDIGTPSALIAASADLITGRFTSPATPTPNSPSGAGLIAPDAIVSENSRVIDGSVVLSEARIGAECIISGSIIGEGAVIEDGLEIKDAFVAPRSHISRANSKGEILGF